MKTQNEVSPHVSAEYLVRQLANTANQEPDPVKRNELRKQALAVGEAWKTQKALADNSTKA